MGEMLQDDGLIVGLELLVEKWGFRNWKLDFHFRNSFCFQYLESLHY